MCNASEMGKKRAYEMDAKFQHILSIVKYIVY